MSDVFSRNWRAAGARLLVGALLLGVLGTAASAQNFQPYENLLNPNTRRADGNIRLCIYQQSYLAEYEKAVAAALSEALLVPVEVELLAESIVPGQVLDSLMPYTDDDLFALMVDKLCDGVMGLPLQAGYSDWMNFTRPYLINRNVLAVTNDSYHDLSDIDRSKPIGGRLGSRGDRDFLNYWTTQPENNRWQRYVYFDTRTALNRLLDGTVEGVLISEAALAIATDGNPESQGIHLITTPFTIGNSEIGIVVKSSDKYIRTALDGAIDSLVQSGRIDELRLEYHLTLPAD